SVACDRGRAGGRPVARRFRAGRVRRGHGDLFQPGVSAAGERRRVKISLEGNRMSRTVSRLGALALAAVVAFSAGAASAQTKVVVRSDFKFNGYVSPLALAIDKGFYREAGLDVAIEQGQGSATTVQTVASGVDQFGLADSAVAALGISSQNVPVKVVAV